jgi:hypothetical protein
MVRIGSTTLIWASDEMREYEACRALRLARKGLGVERDQLRQVLRRQQQVDVGVQPDRHTMVVHIS